MSLFRRLVTSISKSGSAKLQGDVTLSAGTNVTLTQAGSDISIAATGSGGGMSIGGTVTGGTAPRVLFVDTGPVLADDAGLTFDKTNDILTIAGGLSGGAATSANLNLYSNFNSFNDTNTGRIKFKERLVFDDNFTAVGSGGYLIDALFTHSGTITSALAVNLFPMFLAQPTLRFSVNQNIQSSPMFWAKPLFQATAPLIGIDDYTLWLGYTSQPKFSSDITSGTVSTDKVIGYSSSPLVQKVNAGTLNLNAIVCFGTYTTPGILTNDLIGCNITDFYHLKMTNPFMATVTIENIYGIYIPDLSVATNRYGIYSELGPSTTHYMIYSNGSAQSVHVGKMRLGSTTNPAQQLEVVGNILLDNTTNNAAELRFREPSGSGTNYTAFKAQAQAGNVTYTLPAADGSSGQVLSTNGSGTLSWATGGGGGGGSGTNKLLDTSTAQTGPVNTSGTPVDLYRFTIPGGTLGTGNVIHVRICGNMLNNSGAARTLTFNVVYGATTVLTAVAEQFANTSTALNHVIDVYLFADGATNAQKASFEFEAKTQVSNGTAETIISNGTAAEDSTVNKDIAVQCNLSFTSANFYVYSQIAMTNSLNR